jgi:predicted RecA/RadA family phage recombinase
MAEAVFRHGDPIMVDYTAGADIDAGDVVIVGNLAGWTTGIAHVDGANTEKFALAAGGGVYEVVSLQNSANGTKVYWDNATKKVTTTSTNNATFGFIVSRGGGGANSVCDVLHKPYV